MGIVTVQVGQAGNQMGHEFLDVVATSAVAPGRTVADAGEADVAAVEQHFEVGRDGSLTARTVAVDMEPKVIAGVVRKAARGGLWAYHPECGYAGARGAGNNWARGYNADGARAGPAVMELVRKRVERCDTLEGIVVHMSVAGGTGSGVGTRLTELLKDAYPRSAVMNHVVWPYSSGEVIVQNYNAALSLSRLASASDGIVLVENDAMHEVCSRMLGTKNVSVDDINAEIARHLAGFLCPARSVSPDGGGRAELGEADGGLPDLLGFLCGHPDYKLLTAQSVPQMADAHREFSNYQWAPLLKTARQMLLTGWPCQEGLSWREPPRGGAMRNAAVASVVTLRGGSLSDAPVGGFCPPDGFHVPWLPCDPVSVRGTAARLAGHDKSVTVLSASSAVWRPLDQCVSRGWRTMASGAFLHQYAQHGTGHDDFVDAFVRVEQLIKSYRELCPSGLT